MSNLRRNITTPIGRFVWGSMHEPQTKDADGNPLVIKSGPDAGKPTQRYAFGLAIKKFPGQQHWAQEPSDWKTNPELGPKLGEWLGAAIWTVGHGAFPNGQAQRPDFSWKVTDGDSTVPNKKGVKPCDREGYPGHWVFAFSSTYAPRCVNANGTAPTEAKAIKPGHFIQVMGTVDGNESTQNPGVYVNHTYVAHSGFGKEIITGPDPSQVGFGGNIRPEGMSDVPVGGAFTPPAPAAGGAPAPVPTPAPIAAPAPLPAAALPSAAPASIPVPAPAAAPAPTPAPVAVTPHPGILNGGAGAPPAPAVPPPAPIAPPAPVRQMTPKAAGVTYEQFIAAGGWNDDLLRAHGYMI